MGLLNPMRDENRGQEPGGRRDDTYDHGLSRTREVEMFEKRTKRVGSGGICYVVRRSSIQKSNNHIGQSMSHLEPVSLTMLLSSLRASLASQKPDNMIHGSLGFTRTSTSNHPR